MVKAIAKITERLIDAAITFRNAGRFFSPYECAIFTENPLKNMKYHFVIAASLGYSSQSAFTYAFRRFTGMTPKKYREMNYVVKF